MAYRKTKRSADALARMRVARILAGLRKSLPRVSAVID